MPNEITMSAKFPGRCIDCGYKIGVGDLIKFNTGTRTAKHVKCPEPSYDGTEQSSIFDMWVTMAQDMEVKE